MSGVLSDNVEKKVGHFNDPDSPDRDWPSYIYTAYNLPAFKYEELVYDYDNYITKMRFQAHSTTDGIIYKDWNAVAKELKENLYSIMSGQKSQAFLNDYNNLLSNGSHLNWTTCYYFKGVGISK